MDNKHGQPDQKSAQHSSANANESKQVQQNVNDSNDPAERMQDGTNDFKNGDQEPSSEASTKQ